MLYPTNQFGLRMVLSNRPKHISVCIEYVDVDVDGGNEKRETNISKRFALKRIKRQERQER